MLKRFPGLEADMEMPSPSKLKWEEEKMLRKFVADLSEQEELLELFVKMGRKGVDYAEDNVVKKAKRDVKKINVLAEQLHVFAKYDMFEMPKSGWTTLM
eukprot:12411413-Karenia_brevis.AAC.1